MNQMKSFFDYLRSNPIYVDCFYNRESVFSEFAKNNDPDIQIVYAAYFREDYEGNASVLYYRASTDKYYEAYGFHCSCFGLEEQWNGDDEGIVFEELEKRVVEGRLMDGETLKKAYSRFLEEHP
jgi:hypothetical protein